MSGEDAVRPLRSSIDEPQAPPSAFIEDSRRSTSYSRGGAEQLKRRTSSVRGRQTSAQRQPSNGRTGSLHTIYSSASMGAHLPLFATSAAAAAVWQLSKHFSDRHWNASSGASTHQQFEMFGITTNSVICHPCPWYCAVAYTFHGLKSPKHAAVAPSELLL